MDKAELELIRARQADPLSAASRKRSRFMPALRTIAAIAGATVLLGAVGAGVAQAAAPAASTRSASAIPTCNVAGLNASLGGWLAGGMNHEGVMLTLKNTTRHTCALRGYPGLGLENARHQVLHSRTSWGSTWYATDPGKRTLFLKPGQTAQANIAWTHVNTGTSGAVKASCLEVTPPASRAHKLLPFNEWVDFGRLDVTAMAYHIKIN
jgi:hypothetical protein